MLLNRSSLQFAFFQYLIFIVLLSFVSRVSALPTIPSPWYIQNFTQFELPDPNVHLIQTVRYDYDTYIFIGQNASNQIMVYSDKKPNSGAINMSSSVNASAFSVASASTNVFQSIGTIVLQSWTFDRERRWSTVSFTIERSSGNIFAVAFSSNSGLRIQKHIMGNLSIVNFNKEFPIYDIENPYIALDWKMGALMVGLYQHDLPSNGGRNATYIGVFGYDESQNFIEKYNYTGSHLVRTMVLNYQNESSYQVLLRNDTNITYLHPNSNISSFVTLMTTPVLGSARVAGFASYGYDYDTNSSFFLSQSPRNNYSEVSLQKFDQSETNQAPEVLPVHVSIRSHLQMDIAVSDGFVYAAVVSDAGSVYCDHGCSNTTKSDIYVFKYHKNDSSPIAKLVLSFPGDDIISRIDLNNTANALQVVWMSTDSSRSTFYSYYFAPFEIFSINPDSQKDTNLIRENDKISIQFSVPPAKLNNGNLSLVPQVYVGRNLARNVQWDTQVLRIIVPRGVETNVVFKVEFTYLPHQPSVESFSELSYGPPQINAVEPQYVPADGGVRLNIVVDNVDRPDELEVFIGEREVCSDVRLEPDGLSCLVPPGQPSSPVRLQVVAGDRNSNTDWHITYYTPIDEISELIQDPLERKKINLTQCPDYPGAPEQLQFVIVALPASDYGLFFLVERGGTALVEAKETRLFINESLWYQPSPTYHGIFRLQYYCRDKNGGSRTNPIKVRIAVAPYLNCEAEALINDALTLTTRDIFSDKLWLKLSTPPQRGNITPLQSEDAIPMKYDQAFQENTVRYVATYAVANRTWLPTDKITYYAVNSEGLTSRNCTLKFSVSCAPLFLNVFNPSLRRVCASCPNNAVCSPNGLHAPIPSRGNWKSRDGVFVPCASRDGCAGSENSECTVGYTGIRCGQCSAGYYKLNKECLPCQGDATGTLLTILAILIGGAILVSVIIRYAENGPSLGFATIIINFIQMNSIVRELKLNWTSGFHTTMNGVSFFMFNPELLSPECFLPIQGNSYSFKFRLILGIPLALISLLLFFAACNSRIVRIPLNRLMGLLSSWGGRAYKAPDAAALKRHQSEIFFAMLRAFNTVLTFIYLIVASKSLSFFDCTKEADGHSYLDSDPGLRCYEEEWWKENQVLAWSGVILYVIGIPIYFFGIFYFFYQGKHQGAFFVQMKKICKEAVSEYIYVKPQFQYLVFVQILLKFLVISIQQFFTRYATLQVLMMLFVCFISYVFYHEYRPYTYESLNKLESLSSLCSAAILGIGLLLFTNQFPSEDQRLVLTATLLTIMALFIVATAVAVVHEFSNAMKNKSATSVKGQKPQKKKMVTQAASRVQLMGNDV